MLKNIVEDTVDQQFYFTYHHTRGDSMSIMNPDQMDSNVLGIAVLTYILADLENTIGRTWSIRVYIPYQPLQPKSMSMS